MRIKNKEFINLSKPVEVYDIEIDNICHNFTLSNGCVAHNSGKTSLFEALFYCLTGQTTKDIPISSIVNHNSDSKTVKVVLNLSINDTEYVIERMRIKNAPVCNIYVKENDDYVSFTARSKDIQDDIYSLLGITDFEIKLLSYYSVDNSVLFNTLTKNNKNVFFAKLMGFYDLDKLE